MEADRESDLCGMGNPRHMGLIVISKISLVILFLYPPKQLMQSMSYSLKKTDEVARPKLRYMSDRFGNAK